MMNIVTETAVNSRGVSWSDVIKVLGGVLGVIATIFVARLKASLDRVGKLEADLAKSRGKAYGDIWKLTGSLNLFGPMMELDLTELSGQLTNWYFARGWVLTEESKQRYFLLQEFLGFLSLRSIIVKRPADEFLYGGQSRTVALVRQRRTELLNIGSHGDESSYSVEQLGTCVSK